MKQYDALSTKVQDMPTQTLRVRGRHFWDLLSPVEQKYVDFRSKAGLTSHQAKTVLGLDRVPTGGNVTKAYEIMQELRRRDPMIDASDLLIEYRALYIDAKNRNQFGVCRQILDSMARISGTDQPRMDAQLDTTQTAPALALDIIRQIADGRLPAKEGQALLQSIETGAKLSIAQRAIDGGYPAGVTDVYKDLDWGAIAAIAKVAGLQEPNAPMLVVDNDND